MTSKMWAYPYTHLNMIFLNLKDDVNNDLMMIQEYKSTPEWSKIVTNVVEQIRLDWGQDQFSVEEVERVEGILFVNGLELPVQDPGTWSTNA